MINKSPCRGCPDQSKSKEETFSRVDACTDNCVPLLLYQRALSKAEKVGVPKMGTCALCRRPDMDTYCQDCTRAFASVAAVGSTGKK